MIVDGTRAQFIDSDIIECIDDFIASATVGEQIVGAGEALPRPSTRSRHRLESDALPDEAARWDRRVEFNVIAQVENLRRNEVIQAAWAREGAPSLHGWMYRMDRGTLEELVAIPAPEAPAA